ncbi:MAG: DMT family transporter [Rhodobacteraceae bacterium]|nr:DMT family transporter [Paracoccaceae bacterium]
MSGSIAGFTAIAVAGRQIGPALDTFEMMLYRSAIGFALVAAFALATGRAGRITADRLGTHALRNAIHFAGQNLWLHALGLIPLAQLFALEFSTPLIVALLAPLALGERLTPRRLAATVLGFAGVLVVARPFAAGGLSAGALVALASALAFALTALVTKRLTRTTDVTCILFWLTLMQTGLALATAGADGRIALPAAALWPWVALLGVAGLAAHVGLTMALSLAPATVVTPIDFLRLPVIAVVGWLAYAEAPDPLVLAGGAVILAANWINLRGEARVPSATA